MYNICSKSLCGFRDNQHFQLPPKFKMTARYYSVSYTATALKICHDSGHEDVEHLSQGNCNFNSIEKVGAQHISVKICNINSIAVTNDLLILKMLRLPLPS